MVRVIQIVIEYYSNLFSGFYDFLIDFWNLIEPFLFAFAIAWFLAMIITLCFIVVVG